MGIERAALVVDVVSLLRRPGGRREIDVEIEIDPGSTAHDDDPWGTSVAVVDRVAGSVVVESMSDSLTVSGSVAVTWHGECRRCLEPAEGVTEVELHEVFERKPTEGETYPIDEHVIDLAPMLHELVLLSLPVAPLCAEECAGPDPERFPAQVEDDTIDTEPDHTPDPRWAALAALEFD